MILACDVGTTTLKLGLIDEQGRLLALAQAETSFTRTPWGGYEADARQWVQGLLAAARKLPPDLLRHAAAIVASGNGPTVVPVDAEMRAVHNALLWMDRRGAEEANAEQRRRGLDVDTSFFLSKILWFERHRPDVAEQTAHYLGCPEFVCAWLTGEACTILPTPAYARYYWTREAAAELGIDPRRLAPTVLSGERAGALRARAAADLGLQAGLPVVAGGPDFIVSLLGTATVTEGSTNDRSGSSEGINRCSAAAVADSRLISLPHIVPSYTNVSGVITTSGKALDWFREASGASGAGFEAFVAAAMSAPAGARRLLFLPYLAGERSPHWDPLARGAFVGLSLAHGWAELARAVLESIGFAVRDVLETMRENGLHVEELRVAGAQARSEELSRIKADITGLPLLVPEVVESELMGDACLGLAAVGRFASAVEASQACFRVARCHEPRPETRALYDELFGLYRELYPRLQTLFPQLVGTNAERGGAGEGG